MNRRFIEAGVLLVTVLMLAGCSQNEAAKKPVPQNQTAAFQTLQEAAEKDPYQQGCVSCHKKTAEVDRSLPAYVERIAGHPKVDEGTINACYKCHEAQKDYNLYKKFFRGTHQTHWQSETFYGAKGTCYSCHTAETNGVAGIKNYPLAGYRAGISAKPAEQKPQPQPQQTQPKSEAQETKEKPAENQQPDKQQPDKQQPNKQQPNAGGKLFDSGEAPSGNP